MEPRREQEAGSVEIPVGGGRLQGELVLPRSSRGVVLFAHGSGSSRRSPRNHAVARRFERFGFGTLLFDLLLPAEARTDSRLRFDIVLLAERLRAATDWLAVQSGSERLPFGYFGASTGAAAALAAAADRPERVGAVVSRGGRPDLAGGSLQEVAAPTLLIVGSEDPEVLALNRRAYETLSCERRLEVVDGAGHLFEEPGALERVAQLAGEWFLQHLDPDLAS